MSTPDPTPEQTLTMPVFAGDTEVLPVPETTSFAGASDTGRMHAPQDGTGPRTVPWVMSKGSPVVLEPVLPVARPYAVWDSMGDAIGAAAVRCDGRAYPEGKPEGAWCEAVFTDAPVPVDDGLLSAVRGAALNAGWQYDPALGFLCPACRDRHANAAKPDPIPWDDGPGTDEYEKRLAQHVSCLGGVDLGHEMNRLRVTDLIALARPEDPDTLTFAAAEGRHAA